MSLLQSPLHHWHLNHGAKMAATVGWEIPLHYSSGITAEHNHTRTQASLFDFSHMGKLRIHGPQATKSLALAITANLNTLQPGRCRYSFFLNPDGSIKDDFILFRLEQEAYLLIMNPGNYTKNCEELAEMMPGFVQCENISQNTAKLDLQGPKTFTVLDSVLEGTWRRLPYYGFMQTSFAGQPLLISRTGFTGELGVELYCPVATVEQLWLALTRHELVQPAGLGARDTLRLEIGLPVYGQDLDDKHTPAEAGFAGLLNAQADYQGKEHAHVVKNKLVGLCFATPDHAVAGDTVMTDEGTCVGYITSSLLSPSLNKGIALAYVENKSASSDSFQVQTQKGRLEAKRSPLPFYTKGTARHPLL